MKFICDEYDNKWKTKEIFKINPWTFSKPHIIFSVNERIRLANIIKPTELSDFDYKYLVPPLSEYLLLTCIDQLGQPVDRVQFDQWIVSKSKKNERDAFISKIDSNLDNLEFTLLIYKNYQSNYGVKNSFINCFENGVNNEDKERLLATIEIENSFNYPENISIEKGNDLDKINYLYSVRNNFTHRTKTTGPYAHLWPDLYTREQLSEKEVINSGSKSQRVSVTENYIKELEIFVKCATYNFIRKNGL